jgi:predicted N-acetyltransferase YhbS
MSFAVVVDAKDVPSVNFYKKFGFIALSGHRLMLPMKTIERNFEAKSL